MMDICKQTVNRFIVIISLLAVDIHLRCVPIKNEVNQKAGLPSHAHNSPQKDKAIYFDR